MFKLKLKKYNLRNELRKYLAYARIMIKIWNELLF